MEWQCTLRGTDISSDIQTWISDGRQLSWEETLKTKLLIGYVGVDT